MKLFQIEKRNLTDIIIQDRARNDVGDVTSLANSISMVGQLTPILINTDNVLIDGLHRLAALKMLERSEVEVRVVDNINKDDNFLIELLSNMDRKEFLWHEEIDLKYKLHSYWKNTAEEAKQNWGYRETAKRLQCSLGGLATDLAFAEALKVFPELKNQSTKSRAKELYKSIGEQAKAIQRMDNFTEEEKSRLADLTAGNAIIKKKDVKAMLAKTEKAQQAVEDLEEAEAAELEQEIADNVSSVQVIYVAEDYKTFLNKIPDNSVGMVELDPPYAIEFNENYGKANKIQSKAQDWDEKQLYEFYLDYLPLIYQKMLDCSWVLCWTGKEHFTMIQDVAQKIGFFIQPPGAWIKTGGSTNQPKRCLVSNWEMYLLLRKGGAQFNVSSLPSAIQINTVSAANRIHQWEKPIELYDHFLKALGKPGSIFLSPFAGSGNCLISAAKSRMVPIGCDQSQKYIPQFYARLQNFTGISADVGGL